MPHKRPAGLALNLTQLSGRNFFKERRISVTWPERRPRRGVRASGDSRSTRRNRWVGYAVVENGVGPGPAEIEPLGHIGILEQKDLEFVDPAPARGWWGDALGGGRAESIAKSQVALVSFGDLELMGCIGSVQVHVEHDQLPLGEVDSRLGTLPAIEDTEQLLTLWMSSAVSRSRWGLPGHALVIVRVVKGSSRDRGSVNAKSAMGGGSSSSSTGNWIRSGLWALQAAPMSMQQRAVENRSTAT